MAGGHTAGRMRKGVFICGDVSLATEVVQARWRRRSGVLSRERQLFWIVFEVGCPQESGGLRALTLPAPPLIATVAQRSATEPKEREGQGGVLQGCFRDHTVQDEGDFQTRFDDSRCYLAKHGLLKCSRKWGPLRFPRWVAKDVDPASWRVGRILRWCFWKLWRSLGKRIDVLGRPAGACSKGLAKPVGYYEVTFVQFFNGLPGSAGRFHACNRYR